MRKSAFIALEILVAFALLWLILAFLTSSPTHGYPRYPCGQYNDCP